MSAPTDFMRFVRACTSGAPSGAAPETRNLSDLRLYCSTAVEANVSTQYGVAHAKTGIYLGDA